MIRCGLRNVSYWCIFNHVSRLYDLIFIKLPCEPGRKGACPDDWITQQITQCTHVQTHMQSTVYTTSRSITIRSCMASNCQTITELTMMSLFLLYLLSIVPSSLAFRSGAPPQACGDLMPQHGVQSAPSNDGFFLLGDVFNGSYIPGRTYGSKNIY